MIDIPLFYCKNKDTYPLLNITENDYNNMLNYYNNIKHLFSVEGLYDKIIKLES